MPDDIRRGTAIQRVVVAGTEIDAVFAYEPQHEAEATEHPVETGANPTDHIRIRPVVLQLDGAQSATPLSGNSPDSPEQLALRPRQTYEFLTGLFGQLVTVTTELRTYENMALLKLNAPRDAGTGEVLNFSAQFRQVTIVENNTVVEASPAQSPVKQLGKKDTTPTDQATVNKSAAASLKDSGSALLKKFTGN